MIKRLERRVGKLEERLNKNSKNSHMPPSKDSSIIKAVNKPAKGGRRGGQKGHMGNTLDQFKEVDEIIEIGLPEYCNCGHKLKEMDIGVYDTRQVVDIPVQKIYRYRIPKIMLPMSTM